MCKNAARGWVCPRRRSASRGRACRASVEGGRLRSPMLRRSVEIWTWKTRNAVSAQRATGTGLDHRRWGRIDMHHSPAAFEYSADELRSGAGLSSAMTAVKCRANPHKPIKIPSRSVKSDISRDAVWTSLYDINRKWQPVHNVSVKRMTKSESSRCIGTPETATYLK